MRNYVGIENVFDNKIMDINIYCILILLNTISFKKSKK